MALILLIVIELLTPGNIEAALAGMYSSIIAFGIYYFGVRWSKRDLLLSRKEGDA